MNRLAFLALAAAGVFWGMGFPLGKLALRETAAAHVVLLRFAVAALVALPFALRGRETRSLFRSPVVLLAGALYGVAFLVQFEGLARVSVTLAALLVGVMPALIALSARFLGERVSGASWIGVAAATLGAVLIAGKPGGAGTPLGVALSLAALVIFLAWLFVLRKAPATAAPMAIPAVTVVVAAATILPIALVMHGAPKLDLSVGAWAGIVGQGLFSTLLATAAWQFGSARVGSASAGVFINIEPLMGAAIGVLLFGDHLTLALGVGGLLILIGSFVVVLGEKQTPPSELPAVPPTPA
ncbi:DMT family transporter [Phenylobacterium sp.]|uniref:DMT family transporter n=1 Tax=Phenylobacterium sp. TaxID=1871053 RepID=UPI00272EF637|nr:DMT family transporter [Phenylobacterium sp.]MDP1598144.1 DMT family transporter [Phenylobacterium sp.]MDP3592486.1 DMT family transporter [Phenylobacterium sp.]